MSRAHASKSSGKAYNSTTSAGKKRFKAKAGQPSTSTSHNRTLGACTTYELDVIAGPREGITTEKAEIVLNEPNKRDRVSLEHTSGNISRYRTEEGAREISSEKRKGDKEDRSGVNTGELSKAVSVPCSVLSRRQLLMWYVYNYMHFIQGHACTLYIHDISVSPEA